MKILHVADLHLDSPFVGIGKQNRQLQSDLVQAPYEAFSRCVSIAINREVDMMLIVGDLYDSTQQTVYAQHFLYEQFERLNKANIPVIISFGNHDYINEQQGMPIFPENCYIFKQPTVERVTLTTSSNETVTICGFSYHQRWMSEEISDKFPNRDFDVDYMIGMIHGDVKRSESESSKYATFSLTELINKEYDYWALGHIHQAQTLCEYPLIQYSGTIQGRNRNELGDKGAYLITLNEKQQPKSEFISLAGIIWQSVSLTMQSDWSIHDIIHELQKIQTNYYEESQAHRQSYLVQVHLLDFHLLSYSVQKRLLNEDILELLEDSVGEHFIKIFKISFEQPPEVKVFEYDQSLKQSYLEAISQYQEGSLYNEALSRLMKNTLARRYLKDMIDSEEFKQDALIQIKQLLHQMFDEQSVEEVEYENKNT